MEKVKILLVDDEKAFLEATKIYLEKVNQNYQISAVSSAKKALKLISNEPFEVIISDYLMPKMDGLGFLAQLRENGNSIPFIMFTGKGREEVIIQALNLGADYYLQKGGDPKSQFRELSNLIQKALEKKRAEEAFRESEKQYRTLVETMNDGLGVLDANGVFTYVNDKFCEIWGYAREEILGRLIHDFLDEENLTILEEQMTRRKKGKHGFYELVWTGKGGRKVPTIVSSRPIFDTRGIYQGSVGVITDITEFKRVEDELRKLTQDLGKRVKELNCLFEVSKLLAELDKPLVEGFQKVIDLIPSAWQYPNITCARVVFEGKEYATDNFNKTAWKLAADIIVLREKAGLLEVYCLEEKPECYEGPFLKEERALIDNLARELGKFIERKRAEEVLKESEEKFRTLAEQALAGIFIVKEGRIVFANETAIRISGYPLEELSAEPEAFIEIIVHPDDRAFVLDQLRKKQAGTEEVVPTYDFRIISKSGEIKWLSLYSKSIPYEGGTAVQAMIVDITKQKRVAEELHDNKQRLELALKGAELGLWDWNVQTGELIFNERWVEMLGYAFNELEPNVSTWESIIHPDDILRVMEMLNRHLEGKTPFYESEHRVQTKSSEWKWIQDRGKVVEWDSEGRPLRATGTYLDITHRMQVAEELRIKNSAVNSSINAIAFADLEGTLTYVNKAYLDLWGYEDEQAVLGKQAIIFWQLGEKAKEVIKALFKRGSWIGELPARRNDGSPLTLQLSASIVTGEFKNPICMMASFVDITERKRAEVALQQQQQQLQKQRDELEYFASTVAHDLRGKLQIISLYNTMVESEFKSRIEEQLREISSFLEDLLLLAKKGEILGPLSKVDLNQLIDEISEKIFSLNPKLKAKIRKLPTIQGDPIKLRQVFENLLMNVVKHAEATKVELFSEEDKKEYRIFIRDNGKGISKERQQTILESLLTKKYSTLGLLIVIRILQAHNSSITFESGEGKGTTIIIHLPKKTIN